jgi:hypothetical protein
MIAQKAKPACWQQAGIIALRGAVHCMFYSMPAQRICQTAGGAR